MVMRMLIMNRDDGDGNAQDDGDDNAYDNKDDARVQNIITCCAGAPLSVVSKVS